MKRTLVAGVGMVLALGAVPGVALAHSGSSDKKLSVKVAPTKHVKSGKTITLKAKHALKKAKYDCDIAVISKKDKTDDVPDIPALDFVTSSKHGTFTCKMKFTKFSGSSAKTNTKVGCPVSKKLKKKFTCAVIAADAATSGKKQLSVTPFTAKK